jgi:DNA invertase Pin-like site-specific DNA recombinase
MTSCGYARVSTDRQSLESRVAALKDAKETRGIVG